MSDPTDDMVEAAARAMCQFDQLDPDEIVSTGLIKPSTRRRWEMREFAGRAKAALRTDRDRVVEECAKVADEAVSETRRWKSPGFWMAQSIAQSIRALKGDNHAE